MSRMDESAERPELELELGVVIVDFGMGSKVLKLAKQNGIPLGLVVLGMGTLKNRILEFLQIADVRKEIVVMAAPAEVITAALEVINERLHFEKPFHGIGFTMPLRSLTGFGARDFNYRNPIERKDTMNQAIIVIVDRGKADEVMEVAVKAGARGGTIIKARNSADEYEVGKLFHMDIEPEKEFVMILAETAAAETITAAIRDQFQIDEGGHGVILCQDVNKTYGVKKSAEK